jgi:hypothetical protein
MKKIINRDSDLNPIILNTINFENYKLRFKKPYSFILIYKEFYYWIIDEYLEIEMFEESREELIKSIYSEIDVIWRNYAKNDIQNLTENAIKLKCKLLDTIEEV